MTHPRPRLIKLIAAAGFVALAATGCGRRGSLEPPLGSASAKPVSSKPGAQGVASPRALPQSVGLGGGGGAPDPDAVRDGDEIASSAVPSSGADSPIQTTRGAKRGYTIPKQPFILDPLL